MIFIFRIRNIKHFRRRRTHYTLNIPSNRSVSYILQNTLSLVGIAQFKIFEQYFKLRVYTISIQRRYDSHDAVKYITISKSVDFDLRIATNRRHAHLW